LRIFVFDIKNSNIFYDNSSKGKGFIQINIPLTPFFPSESAEKNLDKEIKYEKGNSLKNY
jgi:hypothetical protein